MSTKTVLASVIVVLVVVGGLAYFFDARLVPGPTSTTATTGSGQSTGPLAMESYNFQSNQTGTSIFMVLVNNGTAELTATGVYYDDSLLPSGPGLQNSCSAVQSGQTCTLTISFGPASLKTPLTDSTHIVRVDLGSGGSDTFSVMAGALYHSTCIYAGNCANPTGTST